MSEFAKASVLELWEQAWKELEEEKKARGLRVEDGLVLDLAKVKKIEKFTRKFDDRIVTRFRYEFEDATYIIPKSLHEKFVLLVKELGPIKVKVLVKGEGRNRSYDAVPLVKG